MNRIRELRLARGWSMQHLAEASGTTKSQIDKLEKGFRRLTVDWMVRIARPLKCDPRDLMGPMQETKSGAFEPVKFGTGKGAAKDGLIPVRRLTAGKQKTTLAPSPIDHVPRPYFLAHAPDAYAVYMAGETMMPMYRPRQLLFVNPHKIPAPGGGVVVTDKKSAVSIREFVKQGPKGIVLREYHPRQRDITIAQGDIAAAHAVAGVVEG